MTSARKEQEGCMCEKGWHDKDIPVEFMESVSRPVVELVLMREDWGQLKQTSVE